MLKTLMLRTTLIAIVWSLSLTAHAFASDPKRFDVAPGDLTAALETLAKQSGIELVYQTDQLKGLSTRGVTGNLSPEDAVTKLLEGTKLTLKTDTSGAMLIALPRANSDPETPVPGSEPSRAPSAPQAFNNPDIPEPDTVKKAGWFERFRLAQNDQSSSSKTSDPDEQKENQNPLKDSDERLGELVVTGSHILGVAPVGSPLLEFSQEDIRLSGYATAGQFMQTLPQNFNGGVTENSSFGISATGGDGTLGTGVDLRGLGNDSTLTLFDGRRMAPAGDGAYVDISAIPLSAIARIEVLPDGASAIYGSDAVGGVVNFVPRTDYNGAETRARLAGTYDGGGTEHNVAQTVGKAWGSGNVLATYEYFRREPIESRQRSFTESAALTTLLPEQKRHSALILGNQQFGDLRVFGNALYTERDSSGSSTFGGPPIDYRARVQQMGATGGVEFKLNENWRSELVAAYNESRGRVVTVFLPDLRFDGEQNYSVFSADGKLEGAIFATPAGEARLALGGQFRQEDYDNATGSYKSDRNVKAAFAELFIPLIGDDNRLSLIRRLDLSLAARYENYSDFGPSTNPKVGLRWTPVYGVDVRGSFGTSFRAPNLPELADVEQFSVTIPMVDPTLGGATTPVLVLSGPNAHLTAEKARSWTAGFDLRPTSTPGAKFGFTYFSTRFTDRIVNPTLNFPNLDFLVHEDELSSVIDRSPSAALIAQYTSGPRYFPLCDCLPEDITVFVNSLLQNLAVETVKGVDLLGDYRFSAANGEATLSLNGQYLFEHERQLSSTTPSANVVNTAFNPLRLRLRGGASWSGARFGVALFGNYSGEYEDNRGASPAPIGSWTTVDASLSYRFSPQSKGNDARGTMIQISAVNLFDSKPPFVASDFGFNFDSANANALGRFISVQLKQNW